MAWGSFGIFARGENANGNPYIELPTDPEVEGDAPRKGLLRKPIPYFSYFNVPNYILALSVTVMTVAGGLKAASMWHAVTDGECDAMLRAYSKYLVSNAICFDCASLVDTSVLAPLANAIEYEWVQFGDGSMPSIYKGPPTAGIEKAWNDLWDCKLFIPLRYLSYAYNSGLLIDGAFNVPLEKLIALNKSSLDGDFRLVGSEHGGGVAGLLEGFHQIHCLVRHFLISSPRRSWPVGVTIDTLLLTQGCLCPESDPPVHL